MSGNARGELGRKTALPRIDNHLIAFNSSQNPVVSVVPAEFSSAINIANYSDNALRVEMTVNSVVSLLFVPPNASENYALHRAVISSVDIQCVDAPDSTSVGVVDIAALVETAAPNNGYAVINFVKDF